MFLQVTLSQTSALCVDMPMLTTCFLVPPCVVLQVIHGVFEVWLFCYFSRVGGQQGVAAPVAALPYMPVAFMLYTSDFCYTSAEAACCGKASMDIPYVLLSRWQMLM